MIIINILIVWQHLSTVKYIFKKKTESEIINIHGILFVLLTTEISTILYLLFRFSYQHIRLSPHIPSNNPSLSFSKNNN